jgi:hypothetical protein
MDAIKGLDIYNLAARLAVDSAASARDGNPGKIDFPTAHFTSAQFGELF